VRTWSFTFARRYGWRANVKLYVPSWNCTCARKHGWRANMEFHVRTWSVKKLAGWPLRATVPVHFQEYATFQALCGSVSFTTCTAQVSGDWEDSVNICLRDRRWHEIFCQWCQEQVGVFSFLPEQCQWQRTVTFCMYRSSSASTPVAVPLAAVILFLVSWASSLKRLSGGGLFTTTRRRCVQLTQRSWAAYLVVHKIHSFEYWKNILFK